MVKIEISINCPSCNKYHTVIVEVRFNDDGFLFSINRIPISFDKKVDRENK